MPELPELAWNILGKDAVEKITILHDNTQAIADIELVIAMYKKAPDQGESKYDKITKLREDIRDLRDQHGLRKDVKFVP